MIFAEIFLNCWVGGHNMNSNDLICHNLHVELCLVFCFKLNANPSTRILAPKNNIANMVNMKPAKHKTHDSLTKAVLLNIAVKL